MKTQYSYLRFLNFLFILLFINVQLFGQETNKKSIKLYSNFNFVIESDVVTFDKFTNNLTTVKSKNYQLGYITPAYRVELTNGNSYEIELSRLMINRVEDRVVVSNDSLDVSELVAGVKNTNLFVAFRFEYAFSLRKKTEAVKLLPSIGLSINPFFESSSLKPIVSTQFPTKSNQIGALLAVVPRINYDLKGNWYLDLNVPINICETMVSVDKQETPVLTKSERTTTNFNFELFPKNIMVRFGIGVRI